MSEEEKRLRDMLNNLFQAARACSQMIDRSPDKDTANAYMLRDEVKVTKEYLERVCPHCGRSK